MENSKQRLFEVMGKLDKSFKINEATDRYFTVEKSIRGIKYVAAYPDEYSSQSRKGLENWAATDSTNRKVVFVNNEDEANEYLKNIE